MANETSTNGTEIVTTETATDGNTTDLVQRVERDTESANMTTDQVGFLCININTFLSIFECIPV